MRRSLLEEIVRLRDQRTGAAEETTRAELIERTFVAAQENGDRLRDLQDGAHAIHDRQEEYQRRLEAKLQRMETRGTAAATLLTVAAGAGLLWGARASTHAHVHAREAARISLDTAGRVDALERLVRAADNRAAVGFTQLLSGK